MAIHLHSPNDQKRIKKSFWNYPSIPLAFARDKARIWCGLLAQGIESIVLLSSPKLICLDYQHRKTVIFNGIGLLFY